MTTGKRVKRDDRRLRRWELALLLGVGLAALLGVWLDGAQAALADRMIRLHVVANSDSAADQAIKLEVRDAVLARAEALIPEEAGLEEVQSVLSGHLEELALAGADALAQAGCGEPVTVSLEEDCWFPTRDYADFSLPAGRYTALRVVIGAGEGHNWWCVVFPPLCLGSVSQMADTGLSDRQVALITGADEGYQIQFKAVELWEQFRGWIEGR